MPTYIVLQNFTHQGIASVKESPNRADAVKENIKAMGVKWKGHYLTMGRYDFVSIIDAPDDETVAKLVLANGSQGNIRTETLRAFSEDEFRQIVAALP